MKLAFYKAKGTLFNALIRQNLIAGCGPYSHVELVISGDLKQARTYSSSNWNPCGVRFATIDLTNGNWELVDVPVSVADEAAVTEFCAAMVKKGYGYNWWGILGFVLPFGEHDSDDRFCSEACVEALQRAGLFVGLKPWLISPNKLYRIAAAL